MLIIAHRGASGEYPENTLKAFEQAIVQQADGIELDVQLHPSGDLLLMHDRFLDHNTRISGHFSSHSVEEIRKASLSPEQAIITLEQALALIAGRCVVNIELKSVSSDINELTQLLNRLKTVINEAVNLHHFDITQFIFSSFNHILLKYCQEQFPEIKRAALIACHPVNITSLTAPLDITSINPSIDCLNEYLVQQAHKEGMEVWVYTVNRPYDITLCDELGVDAIFTDFPARTRDFLNNSDNST